MRAAASFLCLTTHAIALTPPCRQRPGCRQRLNLTRRLRFYRVCRSKTKARKEPTRDKKRKKKYPFSLHMTHIFTTFALQSVNRGVAQLV